MSQLPCRNFVKSSCLVDFQRMQDIALVWRLGIRVRDRVKLGLGGGGGGDKHKQTHKKKKSVVVTS